MAYQKPRRNWNRSNNKPTNFDDIHPNKVVVGKLPEGVTNDTISVKALKSLPDSQSAIATKVDPYSQLQNTSSPYALLLPDNRKIGGVYKGVENTSGAGVPQYVNNNNSKFLHSFDCIRMRGKVNYRYLPIHSADTDRGWEFKNSMIRATSEALSQVTASTFTLQPAMEYQCMTDMPYYDPATKKVKSDPNRVITDLPEIFFVISVHYQCVLQEMAAAVNAYSYFRNNQGTMMRRSWDRETPRLTTWFGAMNKKTIQGAVNALAITLEGEYFDAEWMRQVGTITSINGARSNAMTDALVEFKAQHYIPSLKFWSTNGTSSKEQPIYDSDRLLETKDSAGYTLYERLGWWVNCATSVFDTLTWVRNATYRASQTEVQRVNKVGDTLRALSDFMTYFKIRFADMRAVFDIMQRVGLNNWSKIFKPGITRDTNLPTPYNLTITDMFKLYFSSGASFTWNAATKKWQGISIWNRYLGIPEFDKMSGGSVLSLCFKSYSATGSDDNTIAYLPVMFGIGQASAPTLKSHAVNRLGTVCPIYQGSFAAYDHPVLSRLFPLESVERSIYLPVADRYCSEVNDMNWMDTFEGAPRAMDEVDQSMLAATFLSLCGFSVISPTVEDGEVDLNNCLVQCDPDMLAFLDFEIEDITNEVITYSRSKGPFRVNISTGSSLGFGREDRVQRNILA